MQSNPRQSEGGWELPEPYESLIDAASGSVGSAPTEEAKARLIAFLARDLTHAIASFNATTTKLNKILIWLTVVLVLLGAWQVWLTLRQTLGR
jgi:hypothetical protein